MKKKGISLIVLVITIIVIIILATAVIVTFIQNNPIENAKVATKKWNDKVLQEKADLFELDLLAEFQQQGLGSIILPDYAKEAYINAIKEGKTEDEARTIGKESFVPPQDKFFFMGGWFSFAEKSIPFTPLYRETKRVYDLINKDEDGVVDLNIDTSIVPQDLVDCLNKLQADKIELANGTIDSTEFNKRRKENDPLWSFILRRKDGKYYSQIAEPVIWPYFVWDCSTQPASNYKIAKLNDFNIEQFNYYSLEARLVDISTLMFDPNYTELNAFCVPPVEGDCEVIFPHTLKRINKNALWYISVNKLVIPSNVEYIDEEAWGSPDDIWQPNFTELVIKKEKGSIPGEPWGLDTTQVTIKWEPEE